MKRERLLLAAWAVVVFGLAVRAFARGTVGEIAAIPVRVEPRTIDVNRASLGELRALPGIGAARAEAIVLHRVRHGPFRTIEELDAVVGLGPETVAELRPFVSIAAAPAGAR